MQAYTCIRVETPGDGAKFSNSQGFFPQFWPPSGGVWSRTPNAQGGWPPCPPVYACMHAGCSIVYIGFPAEKSKYIYT